MKVLVVGSGGREHALIWKLAQSSRVSKLYCAPGNAGIESLARCVPIPADDIAGLKAFAHTEGINLTVVGPERPLALGIVDAFRTSQLEIFGPTRAAARIESSKVFAKDLMVRHGIPTATASSFDTLAAAVEELDKRALPIVIKADGLAQGKGVVVAATREEARQAAAIMLGSSAFGEAGRRIVIEEFLPGEELTIMAFTDGKNVRPMLAAQDHKRVGESDTGPNTGGMGAYAPAPIGSPGLLQTVLDQVLRPIIRALSRLGSPFQGVLYAGLMIVRGTPYVLEFNARFGDPEAQVVLPLLKTDLLDVLEATVEHRLDELELTWHAGSAVCVVLTCGGYPGAYETGKQITGLDDPVPANEALVFQAGTKRRGDHVVTDGGRVLGVTGIGPHLALARERAYKTVRNIAFEGCHFRTDIARRALSSNG